MELAPNILTTMLREMKEYGDNLEKGTQIVNEEISKSKESEKKNKIVDEVKPVLTSAERKMTTQKGFSFFSGLEDNYRLFIQKLIKEQGMKATGVFQRVKAYTKKAFNQTISFAQSFWGKALGIVIAGGALFLLFREKVEKFASNGMELLKPIVKRCDRLSY